jgi:superfamily II DNA/RNA helicase
LHHGIRIYLRKTADSGHESDAEIYIQSNRKQSGCCSALSYRFGKTLAFLFPVLRNLKKNSSGIQALILVPARELALQIEQVFKAMGTDFKVSVCYGGHDKKIEVNNLIEAPAVLIGTPGRVVYHLRNNNFDPKTIQTLVLDEFDKALELGFHDDMEFISIH